MRFLPLLVGCLLLAGCVAPVDPTDPPDGAVAAEGGSSDGDGSDVGYDAERDVREAAMEACAVPLDGFHEYEDGFLHREAGSPDDAVERIAERVGAEPERAADGAWTIDGLWVAWEYNSSALQVGSLDVRWDLERVVDALTPVLEGEREDGNGTVRFTTSWQDGGRTVAHLDVDLAMDSHGAHGSVKGTPREPAGGWIGLDAAWEATRPYGDCMEDHGAAWDWDAWVAARDQETTWTHGHDGVLHYELWFRDGASYRWHVDATTGAYHTG